jgi:hypothetical protein
MPDAEEINWGNRKPLSGSAEGPSVNQLNRESEFEVTKRLDLPGQAFKSGA